MVGRNYFLLGYISYYSGGQSVSAGIYVVYTGPIHLALSQPITLESWDIRIS